MNTVPIFWNRLGTVRLSTGNFTGGHNRRRAVIALAPQLIRTRINAKQYVLFCFFSRANLENFDVVMRRLISP